MTVPEKDGRSYWERHSERYDASLRLLARPLPRMLELVAASVRSTDRVLEVAAGTGLVTVPLARAAGEVISTDYAAAMVRAVERRVREASLTNVTCEQADVYALRFEPASFDVVVAANVLHLLPDLDGALAALRRVLRPEGKLVVPTFCHDETWTSAVVSRALALTGFPGHRRFTSRSLAEALERAGLRLGHRETLPGLIPIGFVEGTFEEG